MNRLASVLVLLALLAVPAAADIEISGEAEMPRVTVREQNVTPIDLLHRIARATGRVLTQPDDLVAGDSLAAVDLRDRPLDEVVEIIAGTASLIARVRRDTITVSQDPIAPTPSSLRSRALSAHAWAILGEPRRPEVIETRIAMGKLHARLDQFESAVDELNRARDAMDENPIDLRDTRTRSLLLRIHTLIGEYQARLGDWARVVQSLAALAVEPDCDPHTLLLVGRAHAELGDSRSARTLLSRLISSTESPHRIEAELILGQMDHAAGELEGATSHLHTASRSNERRIGGTALLELAAIARDREHHERAVELMGGFAARFPADPRTPGILLDVVDLLEGPIGSPLSAVTLLEKTLALHPACMDPVEATKKLARLWAKAESIGKATDRIEEELERLTEDDPARAGLLEELARILEGDVMPGSTARARVVYRRLAVLPGHRHSARLRAARCLLRIAEQAPTPLEQRRELIASREELRRIPAEELTEDDRALRIELLLRCLERLGEFEEARKLQEESLR